MMIKIWSYLGIAKSSWVGVASDALDKSEQEAIAPPRLTQTNGTEDFFAFRIIKHMD